MSSLTALMPSRIRDMRIERKWSQQDLAERAGTTMATISKMERSMRGLNLEWVERLAKAFGMTSLDLLGGSADAKPPVRVIPVIGRIAAGNWREAIAEPIGHIAATDDLGVNAFGLEPDGSSMDLVAPPGSTVIVDPDQFELRDGGTYAVMNADGETTLKQFRADPARLEPRSSNPDHKAIPLGREQFTVVGRAVAVVHKL